jgi:hypothetical protein
VFPDLYSLVRAWQDRSVNILQMGVPEVWVGVVLGMVYSFTFKMCTNIMHLHMHCYVLCMSQSQTNQSSTSTLSHSVVPHDYDAMPKVGIYFINSCKEDNKITCAMHIQRNPFATFYGLPAVPKEAPVRCWSSVVQAALPVLNQLVLALVVVILPRLVQFTSSGGHAINSSFCFYHRPVYGVVYKVRILTKNPIILVFKLL